MQSHKSLPDSKFCMFINQYAYIPLYTRRRDLVQSHSNRTLCIAQWFGCLERCPTDHRVKVYECHPFACTPSPPYWYKMLPCTTSSPPILKQKQLYMSEKPYCVWEYGHIKCLLPYVMSARTRISPLLPLWAFMTDNIIH